MDTGGSARIRAGSGDTIRTTVCRWDRWVVVRYHLLTDPFKLKFDRLSTNLII
jgi:hypothetical protein